MDAEAFVNAIFHEVYRSAETTMMAVLEPRPDRVLLADEAAMRSWFGGLSASDREIVRSVIRLTAHVTTFGFLVALDGERPLGEEEGEFTLLFDDGLVSDGTQDLRAYFQDLVGRES